MNAIAIPPVTPIVKKLLIANLVVWVAVQIILGHFLKVPYQNWFLMSPIQVLENFKVWQLFTYMFFHALSPFHILFNMLMLWFFGSELEQLWGKKFFLTYYIGSGVGAGLIYCVVIALYSLITGGHGALHVQVMGASGAMYGLLLAYGILFSERVIYFMGFFPLKAKYFVMLAGAIDFASLLSSGVAGGQVAYLAHLGGLLAGFLILNGQALLKRKTKKKKGPPLKLVVDNENESRQNKDPKYWN